MSLYPPSHSVSLPSAPWSFTPQEKILLSWVRDEDSGLNPRESIPTAIPATAFPEGTVFVEVAAAVPSLL
jgi:hypothetical protein